MDNKTFRRIVVGIFAIVTLPISAPFIIRNKFRKRKRKSARKLKSLKAGKNISGGIKHISGNIKNRAESQKITDLRRKLWEGFGEYTSREIERLIEDKKIGSYEKAVLAYEIARWHAAKGDWGRAHIYATKVESFNNAYSLQLRPLMLRIECLIRSERAEEAIQVCQSKMESHNFTEMNLANSNALLALHGHKVDMYRLAILNSVFREYGLAPIALLDPKKGFLFENLICQAPHFTEGGPKVSVLVPVFKGEAHLDIMLTALRGQTWTNLEIIIIDDASPDNSWEIIQRHASQDTRIKSAQNKLNAGAYTTRNRALHMATGEYVSVHDSDDWSHPQMIELQLEKIQKSEGSRGVFGTAARVNHDMRFELRPQRPNLEILHRSYPSFFARLGDIQEMGGWDEVKVNGDDEMVNRFVAKFGRQSVLSKIIQAPLTLQLHHDTSLTQSVATSLNSVSHGLRRTYTMQAAHWHRKQMSEGRSLMLERTGLKTPFPVPQLMVRENLRIGNEYDLVLISDMTLTGGTRRCNQGYINAATMAGMRVGLFNYPRWDLRLKDILPDYFELCEQPNVELLTKEDVVQTQLCILHHPPILKHEMDALPDITTGSLGVLVNQSPMQLRSETPWMYDAETVKRTCRRYFGRDPIWIAISSRVQRLLGDLEGYEPMHPHIWHPPHFQDVKRDASLPKGLGSRSIVIGRHSRDQWMKWPAEPRDMASAYCADERDIEVRILGGIQSVKYQLHPVPRNWTIHEFDSISVPNFIKALDIFVNFMHFDYIEEFGRNTMEAMAYGKPVILDESLSDIFGESAIYCKPQEVARVVRELAYDKERYSNQVRKGVAFVLENCTPDRVQNNLLELMPNKTK